MTSFLRILFGICLVGAAGYFLLQKDNSFSYKFDNLNLYKDKFTDMASTTVASLKNKTTQIFSGISVKAEDFAQSIVSLAADKAKDYAIETVKQTAEESLNKLGESVGISINSSDIPAENYVIYSVKKQANAYFTIKNSDPDTLNYKVDWLDGKIESGQLVKTGDVAILFHNWSNPGEYLISFNISTSKYQKTYKILISVLN